MRGAPPARASPARLASAQDAPLRLAGANPAVADTHHVLSHIGMTRLRETAGAHFCHPELKTRVNEVVGACGACQRRKAVGQGHGELPPRGAPLAPWAEVAVDLIGPWRVSVGGQEIELNALTRIDPVTSLVELCCIDNKTAECVGTRFENEWLARRPRPLRCARDGGGELIGEELQRALQRSHASDAPATIKSPQANAICERMHQAVASALRASRRAHPPQGINEAQSLADSALATAAHATRAATHRAMKASPGGLVRHRDVALDAPLVASLRATQQSRQRLIDESLRRESLKRRSFDYQVGQEVLLLVPSPNKLEPRAEGPFPAHRARASGAISILRSPHVLERVNIRRVRPHRRRQ